jgi:hypothetical protein
VILNTLSDATLTPDDILAILQDEHRHQSSYDPGADPDRILTLDSSIVDWRIACDLVEWKELAAALNEQWNLHVPLAEWKELLNPPKKRKLRGVCEALSRSNQPKQVIIPSIFGHQCSTAGVFFAVREFLERDGADVSQLSPSSLLSTYSIEHSRVFEQDISQLAPGRLPAISIQNPDYERATGFLTLAMLCFFGSALASLWISYLWIPFLFVVFFSIAWVNHVAQNSRPTSVTFGELKTMRDLCRTLAPGLRTQQNHAPKHPIGRF